MKRPWLPASKQLVRVQFTLRIAGRLTSGLATCFVSVSRLTEGCRTVREHTFGGTKVVIVLRMTKLILGKLFHVSFHFVSHSNTASRASHLQLRCLQAQRSGVSSFPKTSKFRVGELLLCPNWLGSRDFERERQSSPCKPLEISSTFIAAPVVPPRCRSFAPRARSSSAELSHSQIEPRGHTKYDVYHKLHPAFLASPTPRPCLKQMRSKPQRIKQTWPSQRVQGTSTCTTLSINQITTPL